MKPGEAPPGSLDAAVAEKLRWWGLEERNRVEPNIGYAIKSAIEMPWPAAPPVGDLPAADEDNDCSGWCGIERDGKVYLCGACQRRQDTERAHAAISAWNKSRVCVDGNHGSLCVAIALALADARASVIGPLPADIAELIGDALPAQPSVGDLPQGARDMKEAAWCRRNLMVDFVDEQGRRCARPMTSEELIQVAIRLHREAAAPAAQGAREAVDDAGMALVKAAVMLKDSLGEYVRQSMYFNPEWRHGLVAIDAALQLPRVRQWRASLPGPTTATDDDTPATPAAAQGALATPGEAPEPCPYGIPPEHHDQCTKCWLWRESDAGQLCLARRRIMALEAECAALKAAAPAAQRRPAREAAKGSCGTCQGDGSVLVEVKRQCEECGGTGKLCMVCGDPAVTGNGVCDECCSVCQRHLENCGCEEREAGEEEPEDVEADRRGEP